MIKQMSVLLEVGMRPSYVEKSKFKVGDRIMYVLNGKWFKKEGVVKDVGKDGTIIIQFDDSVKDNLALLVQPLDITKVKS